jgi:excisionase family DNA binding protein
MKKMLKVNEAAAILGFSGGHLRILIRQNKLKAEKIGRDYFIPIAELKKVKRERSPKGYRNALQKTAIDTKAFVNSRQGRKYKHDSRD